jgi:hypothetical protein
MTGLRGTMLWAGLLLFGMTSSSQAGWVWGWRVAGYGPVNYGQVYYPAYPECVTYMPSATPQPAPLKKTSETPKSNTTKEPPLMGDAKKKGPTVTETRSKSGGYAATTGDRCKVGFWNLTGRDVTLKIDGRQQTIPKNRSLTLDLNRSFAWQMDQGETVTERVPDEQTAHEVLLRQ